MARVISIFELIHADTTHITPIGIDNATGFSGLTDDYSRYHHIDICVQKKNIFQNLINFQIKIKTQYSRGIHHLHIDNRKKYGIQKFQK